MRLLLLLPAICVLFATPAGAYEINTGQGGELHWDTTRDYADSDGRIGFWLQYEGSDEVSFLWETAVRQGFQAWADAPNADLHLFEQRIHLGPSQFHGTTEEDSDKQATIFFVEEDWAYEASVIGLTLVTFVSGGRIIDADIGFNSELYEFTLGEDEVDTDLQTIATHEIGHFFGIGHSADEDATMYAYYGGGTEGRSLHEDDIAAIEHQYPCADLCRSLVDWRAQESGCSLGGAGTGRWLGLALVLVLSAALLRRRSTRGALGALLLVGLTLPMSAESTVVERLPFEDLADAADRVVRARVHSVDAFARGHVWSRISLDVQEDLRGTGPERVVLEQPGGLLDTPMPSGAIGTVAFGMPTFTPGEDVVVFLRDHDVTGRTTVVGLGQGKLDVGADGRLERDLSGILLANLGRSMPPVSELPESLDALRAVLR
jgi:hypothetical protein